MSFGNSGDFDRGNRPNQGPSGQNPGSPYAGGPGQTVQPAPKSNALWWILGILGVLTVGGALVCCGGGYFAFQFGTQVVADTVKSSISADPAIQEHIGDITDISMNLTATGAVGGGNKMVLDLKGEKGTGQVEVVMAGGGPDGQTLQSCVLILPNGERIDVAVDTSGQDVFTGEAVDAMDSGPVPADSVPAESVPADPVPANPAGALDAAAHKPNQFQTRPCLKRGLTLCRPCVFCLAGEGQIPFQARPNLLPS